MFHRSYDLSCLTDPLERSNIQNAVNGVNAACSDMVDAWRYVEQGLLFGDINRTLGDHDHIPKAIFAAMALDNHSGNSFSLTVSALQAIAQDYEGWRIMREEDNSRREGSTNFWNSWRHARLSPYYMSMSGGGSRVSIGPILENFLTLKASRNDGYSMELITLENELIGHLGQDLQGQVNILSQIVSLENSPFCGRLLDTLKKRLSQTMRMEQHNDNLVDDATRQLTLAIESRNPIALKAALNPGWYSVKFHSTELYKKGSDLLSELS
jgi:hypothetical protein